MIRPVYAERDRVVVRSEIAYPTANDTRNADEGTFRGNGSLLATNRTGSQCRAELARRADSNRSPSPPIFPRSTRLTGRHRCFVRTLCDMRPGLALYPGRCRPKFVGKFTARRAFASPRRIELGTSFLDEEPSVIPPGDASSSTSVASVRARQRRQTAARVRTLTRPAAAGATMLANGRSPQPSSRRPQARSTARSAIQRRSWLLHGRPRVSS
jgi:hypothetical protein